MNEIKNGVETTLDINGKEDVNETGKNKKMLNGHEELKQLNSTSTALFGVNENPPWYICVILGFQYYLTMVGGAIAGPIILALPLCMLSDDPGRGELLSTVIFTNGIVTILQSTVGVRLPIIQSGANSFIVAILAVMSFPENHCPANLHEMSLEDRTMCWQYRIRLIQGAMLIVPIFSFIIGFFGVAGLLLKFISPITIAVSTSSIGFSLFSEIIKLMSKHWPVSIGTVALLTLFSQYNCFFTKCAGQTADTKKIKWFSACELFRLFPVLLTLLIMWSLCYILTSTNVLASDSEARTDANMGMISDTPWFSIPYPGQWGIPIFRVSVVMALFPAVLVELLDAIGDYYACARLSGVPIPTINAVNRGISIEAIGCLLAGAWGAITGTAGFGEANGTISITQISSRRVVVCAGLFMVATGTASKVCAFFSLIPEPVIGGILCVLCSLLTAIGISSLQYVDLNSPRNMFIFGLSVFLSSTIPTWTKEHSHMIKTGNGTIDEIFVSLLGTGMFVAGVTAAFLDNTIAGTRLERGLDHLTVQTNNSEDIDQKSYYDFPPFIMNFLYKRKWTRKIPISPTFHGWNFSSQSSSTGNNFETMKNSGKEETRM